MAKITAQTTTVNINKELLNELRNSYLKNSAKMVDDSDKGEKGQSFLDHLRKGLENVNDVQKTAEKMAVNIATGKEQNLHETMLAATHAEMSFQLMVQVRNKVLEAYQEVMRMPV